MEFLLPAPQAASCIMEAEQSKNFNERLGQWIASQGFWFQLRYSMAGSGARGNFFYHLLMMGFRILIFLLVITGIGWVYLASRTKSETFNEDLQAGLKKGLSATEVELSGISRSQGQISIGTLIAKGDGGTFFSSLDARNVRGKMGLFDGLRGKWDLGTLAITNLDVDLRAGADDAESGQGIAKTLFGGFSNVTLGTIEVSKANIRWGYSDRTSGAILGSSLHIQRGVGNMTLTFSGGTFRQNWLRDLTIEKLEIHCSPEGLRFDKATFVVGEGEVQFANMKVESGEQPLVSGTVKLQNVEIAKILQASMGEFVEGVLSGDLTVSGSTNTAEGLSFQGGITLGNGNVVSLRRKIPLLHTLSDIDFMRNYHKVNFTEGSFRIKTSGGGMDVSGIDLVATDMTLDGNLKVRLPTPEELNRSAEDIAAERLSRFASGDNIAEVEGSARRSDVSLRRAGMAASGRGTPAKSGQETAEQRQERELALQRLQKEAAERNARTLRYEGTLRMTVPGNTFADAPRIRDTFTVDAATGRISITVPLEGTINDITVKQAEYLYGLRGR